MSVVNICGFETGDTGECAATSGTLSVQASTVRTGGYALRTNPTTTGTGFVRIGALDSLGAATTTSAVSAFALYARFYFRYATKPAASDEPFAGLDQSTSYGSTIDLELRLNSSGKITVYDSALNLLATGSATLSSGTWYRVEFLCDLSDGVNCAWAVLVDGASDSSGSYTNTDGSNGWLYLGKVANRNGQSVDFFFDDLVMDTAAYPGAGEISALLPSAAGNYQTWTKGGTDSGSHWGQVDEVPPNSDTDYLVSDNTSGHADTEALQDSSVPGISGTVNRVKAVGVFKRDGASNGAIRLRLRSGSTDTDTASNRTTTSAYALTAAVFDTDPATSLAWTTSGLDGLEVGGVERSTTNKSRMTFCAAMVDWTPAAPAGNRRRRVLLTGAD